MTLRSTQGTCQPCLVGTVELTMSRMKNAKGELDEVMGIAGALMAFDYDYWQQPKRRAVGFSS